MKRLRGLISKTLVLLAMVMLSFQQASAATCGCRASGQDVRPAAAAAACAQMPCRGHKRGGLEAASSSTGCSCCCDGSAWTGDSKSCSCPAGSCGQDKADAAEQPWIADPPSTEKLFRAALTAAAEGGANIATITRLAETFLPNAPRHPRLCVLLCRFTL